MEGPDDPVKANDAPDVCAREAADLCTYLWFGDGVASQGFRRQGSVFLR